MKFFTLKVKGGSGFRWTEEQPIQVFLHLAAFCENLTQVFFRQLEFIDVLGGLEKVTHSYLFTPQQIRYLAKKSIVDGSLLKNGFSNLFFLLSAQDKKVYIVGVVWNEDNLKFVPYVYRTENLYRSWSKGNQVFIRN